MLQHLSVWQDFDFSEENFLFSQDSLVYKKVALYLFFVILIKLAFFIRFTDTFTP